VGKHYVPRGGVGVKGDILFYIKIPALGLDKQGGFIELVVGQARLGRFMADGDGIFPDGGKNEIHGV
jgi:hypothetical protein